MAELYYRQIITTSTTARDLLEDPEKAPSLLVFTMVRNLILGYRKYWVNTVANMWKYAETLCCRGYGFNHVKEGNRDNLSVLGIIIILLLLLSHQV